MVFSSIPAYLDPASNWHHHHHQQNGNQIIGSSGGGGNQLIPPPVPPHGSIRPGSMAERARMANIPMPEAALKCPRCESTNTKFCYFNNYSLSQPRHFCKTCRRYWTRGGALRNVPVGGGCRRNKRSSKSAASSKSPASSDRQTNSGSTATISSTSGAAGGGAALLGLNPPPPTQLHPLRFMSPLSQITDNFPTDLVNYTPPPISSALQMNFPGSTNLMSSGIEPWRLHHQIQQFPFLAGLDSSPSGIFPFPSGESGFLTDQSAVRPKISTSMLNQASSVKMEENPGNLNLSRHLLGSSSSLAIGNEQWNTTMAPWSDLSNFSTSSRSNNNPM